MAKFLLVLTTTAQKSDAEKICQTLVKNSLSACTQILGPIRSIYIWKNKMQNAKEYLCIIKTTTNRYRKVETTIRQIHPYELPEIIAIDISRGYQKYLSWLKQGK
ncbi:MAG: divalent-cation tolerance protein CutA [candidate division WOR-3 bacterium]|nr:divalent-cation tolerance protein CutA [candidate division WOR-3 bacterium]